jgi:hypothetical protein
MIEEIKALINQVFIDDLIKFINIMSSVNNLINI